MGKEEDHATIQSWIKALDGIGIDVTPSDFLGTCEVCGESDRLIVKELGESDAKWRCRECEAKETPSESEEEKRERYLANRDDPEEWG
jgi:hypothetical protein